MKTVLRPLALAAITLATSACQRAADAPVAAAPAQAATNAPHPEVDLVARGEYVVRTTGCNDCHTPGYAEAQGQVPTGQWLTGSPLGYRGPWGTTYATNLRLRMAELTEAQWLEYSAKLRTRPIMPDFAVRAMSEDDRRAIYRFVRSLGPAGQPAPVYLPPGQAPTAPYFELVLPAPGPAQAPAAPAQG